MRNDYRYLSCEIVLGDYDSLRAAFGGCSLALRLRALVAAKVEYESGANPEFSGFPSVTAWET